jgi:polar amino acid transport system substrate-binding protein
VTGESPEVARLVAPRLGAKRIEWVQTSFDALIADLREGRFDVIGAGMFITPARAELVRFARPSLRVSAGLLVAAGNPKGLRAYADALASARARVAVLSGSVEEQRLRARGLPAARLLSVPDAASGQAAVVSGAADALALSLPTVRSMARASAGRLEAVAVRGRASPADIDSFSYVAFAFAPGSAGLRQAWNEAQAAVMRDPEYLEAIAPFGFGADSLPSGAVAPGRSAR